jgi:hypothetical protein
MNKWTGKGYYDSIGIVTLLDPYFRAVQRPAIQPFWGIYTSKQSMRHMLQLVGYRMSMHFYARAAERSTAKE